MTGEQPARIDWFEPTWNEDQPGKTRTLVALALGVEMRPIRGRNGYGEGFELVRGDDAVARIYGRHTADGWEQHAVVSGSSCDEVVPMLRQFIPSGFGGSARVSRADSSLDLNTDLHSLDALCTEFATKRGIRQRLITDSEEGFTRYLGAPSSEVQVRAYNKTAEVRAKHPERAADVPENWVRVEVQVRPGKRAAKEAAYPLSPADLWGLSKWSSELAAELLAFEPARTQTAVWSPSNWQRALYWLGVQYGPAFRLRVEAEGMDSVLQQVATALVSHEPAAATAEVPF